MPRNLPRDELVELFPGEDLISIKNKARSIKAKVPRELRFLLLVAEVTVGLVVPHF